MTLRRLVERFGFPAITLLVWSAVLVAAVVGAFRPLDTALRDLRYGASTSAASGNIVFIDIDAPTLETVGVWPWPRSIHARLLDELMRLGAAEVVFDVDFSVASSEAEDAEFERALSDAGGYALLAAFQQQYRSDGTPAENLPLPRFAQYADPVAVNVNLDPDGKVRRYPLAMELRGQSVPSVAALFANAQPLAGAEFGIDYAIDPATVPRIPAASLLAGTVDEAAIAGKRIVIGASAVELRDFFVVPRHGIVPGALLQIVAAESLLQGRGLLPVGPVPVWVGLLIVLAGALLLRRLALKRVIIAGVIGIALAEAAALVLQLRFGLLLHTAAVDAGFALLILGSLIAELVRRGIAKLAAEARLRYLGTHDPLTGTLNRTAFAERVAARLAAGGSPAIVLLDLRRLRAINGTLGHATGDLLLQQVATRLSALGPEAVARLGGGSFALLLGDLDGPRLAGYGETIVQMVASPYQLDGGHKVTVVAIAGATSAAISGRNVETLLGHADMALSAVRHKTGSAVALFEPAMAAALTERQATDTALRTAIGERKFSLLYQPQIELSTGRVTGVEALMRWNDPLLGAVSPARFVPVAEETGQIVELGRWALEAACRDAVFWPEHVRLAVNVSPVQFELGDVAADIMGALRSSGLDPARLDIEITEGVFVHDPATVIAQLDRIRALGVGIALDDFGTGYSSLGYIGQLPLDKIKIDQSFVRRLPADGEALAIVRAVLSLSHALGKKVVAEGVETAEQASLLRHLGCHTGQGYLFAKPLPAASILDMAMRQSQVLAATA